MKTIRVKAEAKYLEKRGISVVAEGIFKRMANGMAEEETDLCRPIYQCYRPLPESRRTSRSRISSRSVDRQRGTR